MEYKIGQKIRIKPKEWFKENGFGDIQSTVLDYCGKEALIIEKQNSSYSINIGPKDLCWLEACFEPIEHQDNTGYKVTEKDLVGEIKDFPIEVVQRMVDCQIEQKNEADVTVFQKWILSGFIWDVTEERKSFWNEVIFYRDFNLFFEKYPKNKDKELGTKKQNNMETKASKITLNGIKIPDGTDVKTSVEDGNIIITFSKQKSEVEEPKFKDGDVLYVEESDGGYIAIVQFVLDDIIEIHAVLHLKTGLVYTNLNGKEILIRKNILSIRYATEEEKQELFNGLAKQKNLCWDEKEFKFEEYRWRAEYGGKYWYIGDDGEIHESTDIRSCFDKSRYNLCNYFQTKELIKQAFPKLKEFFKNLSL